MLSAFLLVLSVIGVGVSAAHITEVSPHEINLLVLQEQLCVISHSFSRVTTPLGYQGHVLFFVGKRQSVPDEKALQHTLNHWDCEACNAAKERAMQVNLSPSLLFRDAAQLWRESRKHQISEGSFENYRQYIKSLNEWFGDVRLDLIHIGMIEEYVEQRQETAGAYRINHEISTIQQILKRAGLWEEINKFYEPMRVPEAGPGIALEPDEETHLFKVAAKKPKWKIAYLCAVISANTTLGPSEIRHLRIGDLDMKNKVVTIQKGTKNKFRKRPIPLNEDAHDAIEQLIEAAEKKGSFRPEHYILSYRPHIAGAKYDPLTPMGSWRTAWDSLRREAGKKFPRLTTLRRYDLRHHAATKLLEDPNISDRTVEEMMGHRINSRIKERYSHIRMQRKWEAVAVLAKKPDPKPVQSVSGTFQFLLKTRA